MKRSIIALLKALRLLPLAHKARLLATAAAPATLAHNFPFWTGRHNETLPIPGVWARLLVAGTADIAIFLNLGRNGFECIRSTLERNGTSLEKLRDVLDFGCGCGRVLRYWNGMADIRIYGTDINQHLVESCRRSVPFAKIGQNSLNAKLVYASESFDLIYAFSVFTHLDAGAQMALRDELRRILRPGGILLFSVHGDAYKPRLASCDRADYEAGSLVVRLGQYPGGNICVAFHPPSYVQSTLAKGFQIVAAVPEGAKGNPVQDLYMFRKEA